MVAMVVMPHVTTMIDSPQALRTARVKLIHCLEGQWLAQSGTFAGVTAAG